MKALAAHISLDARWSCQLYDPAALPPLYKEWKDGWLQASLDFTRNAKTQCSHREINRHYLVSQLATQSLYCISSLGNRILNLYFTLIGCSLIQAWVTEVSLACLRKVKIILKVLIALPFSSSLLPITHKMNTQYWQGTWLYQYLNYRNVSGEMSHTLKVIQYLSVCIQYNHITSKIWSVLFTACTKINTWHKNITRHHHHHHHQFLLSLMGQRASTKRYHLVLSPVTKNIYN
jgi:hypothetical protein